MDVDANDQFFQSLRSQVARFIEDLIKYEWLSNLSTPDIHVNKRQSDGGTDAITLSALAQIRLFVKHHPAAVKREFEGFASLQEGPKSFSRHLVPPLASRDNSYHLWVAPYVEEPSLHMLAMEATTVRNQEWIISLYRDVLNSMKELWVTTRKEDAAPDISDIYYRSRFVERQHMLKQRFGTTNLADLELVVNDRSCGTFGACAASFSRRVSDAAQQIPRASCTVHGDEHANNILVQRDMAYIRPNAWLLVDYVNSTKGGDWVFSVAKMLYWWKFYCVIEKAKQDTELQQSLESDGYINKGRLVLKYNSDRLKEAVPPICVRLEAEIRRLAQEVGKEFGETKRHWQERLQLAQAAAIWGSAAYHVSKYPFAVPIMLGEALSIMTEQGTKRVNHPH